jgi:hypothetical protein
VRGDRFEKAVEASDPQSAGFFEIHIRHGRKEGRDPLRDADFARMDPAG